MTHNGFLLNESEALESTSRSTITNIGKCGNYLKLEKNDIVEYSFIIFSIHEFW